MHDIYTLRFWLIFFSPFTRNDIFQNKMEDFELGHFRHYLNDNFNARFYLLRGLPN